MARRRRLWGDTGTVPAVVEIDGFEDEPDSSRRSFVGTVLPQGHPIREAYIGKPDPSGSRSRNPIAYTDLPEERDYKLRHCACGLRHRDQERFCARPRPA